MNSSRCRMDAAESGSLSRKRKYNLVFEDYLREALNRLVYIIEPSHYQPRFFNNGHSLRARQDEERACLIPAQAHASTQLRECVFGALAVIKQFQQDIHRHLDHLLQRRHRVEASIQKALVQQKHLQHFLHELVLDYNKTCGRHERVDDEMVMGLLRCCYDKPLHEEQLKSMALTPAQAGFARFLSEPRMQARLQPIAESVHELENIMTAACEEYNTHLEMIRFPIDDVRLLLDQIAAYDQALASNIRNQLEHIQYTLLRFQFESQMVSPELMLIYETPPVQEPHYTMEEAFPVLA